MANFRVLAGAAMGALLSSVSMFAERSQKLANTLVKTGKKISNVNFEEKEDNSNLYLLSGVAGALIGGGIALFTAPKSGKQLRNQVAKYYNNISDRTEDVVDGIKHKTQDVVQEIKNSSYHPFHKTATRVAKRVAKKTKRVVHAKH